MMFIQRHGKSEEAVAGAAWDSVGLFHDRGAWCRRFSCRMDPDIGQYQPGEMGDMSFEGGIWRQLHAGGDELPVEYAGHRWLVTVGF